MKKVLAAVVWVLKILLGVCLFALGFSLFLAPHSINAGGISGLAQIVVRLLGGGTVGMIMFIVNLPLFAFGGIKVGKKFFVGSLIGMISSAVALDIMSRLPVPETEPLLAALYGGVTCGLGMGLVFTTGASSGGSDIIVRLLKRKWQNVPIGTINICFDLAVACLTGIAFRNIGSALYSGVTIVVTGRIIDAVVYRFDYSKVALIISDQYQSIAEQIARQLNRGATFLQGEGTYSHKQTKVILTAVKKQQLAELKQLVVQLDPDAFIIVQEAHQVLGDGFSRYSKDAL